jgi:NAD(P)H-dependent flavin oxidoreductase YrpB (nitropropane dioxygenase family)
MPMDNSHSRLLDNVGSLAAELTESGKRVWGSCSCATNAQQHTCVGMSAMICELVAANPNDGHTDVKQLVLAWSDHTSKARW